MFYSEYETTVDDKGRVIIPARFREVARPSEGPLWFMMTLAEDDCIAIYTPKEWEKIRDETKALPRNREAARKVRRRVFTQAAEGVCDRQGRMRVPAPLLAAAGITHDAILAGVGDAIELWDKERWRAYKDGTLRGRARDAEEEPLCPPAHPTS